MSYMRGFCLLCLILELFCEPMSPCQNGGTCNEVGPGDGYMCDCPQDYTGTDCETRRTDILPQNTSYHYHVFMILFLDLALIDFLLVPCILCSCVYLYKTPGAR